jgi:transcriptional regulator with XRE-family HTH domain
MQSASDELADRLRRAMEIATITQSKLAALVGTTQPAVSQWLSGKKDPSSENLTDIARHLKIERRWLVEGIPPMKTENPDVDRDDYKQHAGWGFRRAPDDGGRDYGNANVWSLDPGLDVLVREGLQNAKDAAVSVDKKVEVVFRIISLTGADFSNFRDSLKWDDLREHLDASAENKQKLGTLLRDGLKRVDDDDRLLLLLIEDNGTFGLTGPEKGTGHFTALCRNNLDSNKEGASAGAGGAFGLGKAVLWRASRLSTVLFCSHLAKPEDGQTQNRIFGRCELAWHEVDDDTFAGPGWFGRTDDDGTAASYWGNETLARDLFLNREGTGTTACVVGFHDASADIDRDPVDLARELVRAAAENFFPALVADKLGVRVEVYDSGQEYRDKNPAFAQAVNPESYVPAAVRMLKAYQEDRTVDRLGDDKNDVAAKVVVLTVPKRSTGEKHAEQEHNAVLLLTPADEDTESAGLEKQNHLAMFRGHGMVVQLKSLAGTCLGARPFHALLLSGRAPEFVASDVARSNPQADQAAEMFLRTAEPPSHNQWTATPDLKAVYARGCISRLDAFLKAAADAVRDLVKPTPKDTGDGPNALKELFRIGAEPAPTERPRVVEQTGTVEGDGHDARWRVSARVRMKARRTPMKLTPAVYFLAETGTGTPVGWLSLKAEKGCEARGLSLIVPPDTREVKFSGVTDPRSHPIPATDSCVEVDIKKLVPVKEGKA